MPGSRPGDATARHILLDPRARRPRGALAVAGVAIVPDLLRRILRTAVLLRRLQLLIIVGAALDAMTRVESHGLMRTSRQVHEVRSPAGVV